MKNKYSHIKETISKLIDNLSYPYKISKKQKELIIADTIFSNDVYYAIVQYLTKRFEVNKN